MERTELVITMSNSNGNKQHIVDVAQRVKDLLSPYCDDILVVGSIRRGSDNPHDVDIVLVPKNKTAIPVEMGKIGTRQSGGDKKETWLIDNVQVELYFTSMATWGAMILTYTGSKIFNIGMRALAKAKGLMLNQYGLFKDGKVIASLTEEDIFKALEMENVQPSQRE